MIEIRPKSLWKILRKTYINRIYLYIKKYLFQVLQEFIYSNLKSYFYFAEIPDIEEGPRVIMGVLGSPALLTCPFRLPSRLAVRIIPSPSSALQPERRVYGAAKIHSPPPVLKLNVR